MEEVLNSSPEILKAGKVEATIRKTVKVLKVKTQQELLKERAEKEREEQERQRKSTQESQATQWDKVLKKYVVVPQIGEIESWRER